MAAPAGSGRLAELTIALSLATDLGTGQPMEHGLRTCWLSLAVAEALGADAAARSCLYYVALLRFLGCTSDASETAVLVGGDDVAFNATMAPMLGAQSGEGMRFFVRHQGRQRDREGSGAFVYRRGRYTPLSAIPGATFGSTHADINNRGEIAGTSIAGVLGDDGQLEESGSVLGFVKTRRARVTTFDTPGPGRTSVWGNNNRGQVVGLHLDPGAVEGPDGRYPPNSVHLFVRNRNSRITTVDLPFTYLRGVGDINDRGQIVGTYIDTDGVFRGFRREPDGEITPIDVPGAGTLPLGIDKAGRVVGYYGDEGTTPNPDGSFPPNKIHGFLWDEGRVTTLDVPGSLATYAFRLNNRGQITGGYYDRAGTQHGFVLERGRYRTLTPPGRVESAALGINDRGQIVIPEPTTRLFTVATR